MLDEDRTRGKLEIRGKSLAGQSDAKERKPKKHECKHNGLEDFFTHVKNSSKPIIPAFPPGRKPHGSEANWGEASGFFINHLVKSGNPF